MTTTFRFWSFPLMHKFDSMQNILVPTDFSNKAFNALRYVTELFSDKECTFFLLNVYNEKKGFKGKQFEGDVTITSDELREKSKTRLGYTFNKIKKEKPEPKHHYELISEPVNLIKVVNQLVEKLEIDLVVMGNRGKKSSISLYLESSATKTLQSVKKCPVLTIPKNAEYNPPSEIAFATDYRNPFNELLIRPLIFLTKLCDATIRILHIDTKKELDDHQMSNLDALTAHLEPFAVSFDSMPNFISKTKVIQVFLESSDADLLVMVNNEHGLLEKMMREPIIEKMVFKGDIPFLVIPENP